MLVGMTACGDKPAESAPVSTPTADNSATTTAAGVSPSQAGSSAVAGTDTTAAGQTSTAVGSGTTAKTTAGEATTKPQTQTGGNYNLKKSDFILNESVLAPRYYGDTTVFYTGYGVLGGSDNTPAELTEKSIEAHGLGEAWFHPLDGCEDGYGYNTPLGYKCNVGEWGYSFLNISGNYPGDGKEKQGAGWQVYTPKNDKDALAIIRNWLFGKYSNDAHHHIEYGKEGQMAINGHAHWQHYAAEWGFDCVGAELGENVASHQAHMAFTRGAARQYGIKTAVSTSNWYKSTIGTEESTDSWPGFGSKDGGHSLSLHRRAFILSYMSNISMYGFEASSRLSFLGPEYVDENGILELSSYGKMAKELVGFATANPDIGISYAPIGIVMDFYHGLAAYSTLPGGVSGKSHNKAFGYFPNTPGDKMNWDLFELYYPGGGLFGGYMAPGMPGEEVYQVNTSYGDTCDVLLQNASQTVLNSYPVLLLCGDIKFTSAEVKRYQTYVEQGGTLLCNTAYLKYFESYKAAYKGGTRQDIRDGKGTVIVYGPDYSVVNLGPILQEQLKQYIPFTFSKTVEYLVNVKDGSLIVTVINNDGVTKEATKPPVVDATKAVTLDITYTGDLKIKRVKELYYGEAVNLSGNTVKTTVPAGDYRVFEYVFD